MGDTTAFITATCHRCNTEHSTTVTITQLEQHWRGHLAQHAYPCHTANEREILIHERNRRFGPHPAPYTCPTCFNETFNQGQQP